MNKINNNLYVGILFVLFFVFIIFPVADMAKGDTKKIAILPFKINSKDDLKFLQEGIVDMLTSRLADGEKVIVLNKELVRNALKKVEPLSREASERKIVKSLGANYLVEGSLTFFGKSVSIDGKMWDLENSKPPLSFFKQTKDLDEVIPKINLFASEINEKLFKRKAQDLRVADRRTITKKPDDIHAHPEKMFGKGLLIDDDDDKKTIKQPMASKRVNKSVPLVFTPVNPQATSIETWKSQTYKYKVNGLALGDVDNDGAIDLIFLRTDRIEIHKKTVEGLVKVKKIFKNWKKRYLAIDVADINGNGIPEIFVTAINVGRNHLYSFVVEFDGKKYRKIAQDIPRYFRVTGISSGSPVLLSQKNHQGNPFGGKIEEMVWKDSQYVPSKKVLNSNKINLLGFAMGNVINDGNYSTVVAYDNYDNIRILNSQGAEVWAGKDKYGGSMSYFNLQKVDPGVENRQFFPMRIMIKDIDGDGKIEVLAANNQDIAGSYLKYFRKYTKHNFVVLSWDGLGLSSMWQTEKRSGYVSDFTIGDFDNDGIEEFIGAIILKEGSIIGTKAKSKIIAFDLK